MGVCFGSTSTIGQEETLLERHHEEDQAQENMEGDRKVDVARLGVKDTECVENDQCEKIA